MQSVETTHPRLPRQSRGLPFLFYQGGQARQTRSTESFARPNDVVGRGRAAVGLAFSSPLPDQKDDRGRQEGNGQARCGVHLVEVTIMFLLWSGILVTLQQMEGKNVREKYQLPTNSNRTGGVYFYRMHIMDVSGKGEKIFVETKKLMLLK